MRDIIFSAILIAATVGLIYLIRLLSSDIGSECVRPRADMRIYFDRSCECLEYTLSRLYVCSALRELDLHVTVVDCIATPESRQWLLTLRTKLKRDFEIVTEEKSDGTK